MQIHCNVLWAKHERSQACQERQGNLMTSRSHKRICNTLSTTWWHNNSPIVTPGTLMEIVLTESQSDSKVREARAGWRISMNALKHIHVPKNRASTLTRLGRLPAIWKKLCPARHEWIDLHEAPKRVMCATKPTTLFCVGGEGEKLNCVQKMI